MCCKSNYMSLIIHKPLISEPPLSSSHLTLHQSSTCQALCFNWWRHLAASSFTSRLYH